MSSTDLLATALGKRDSEDQQHQIVDYRMVTFTLGGKDYGIDIMQVKEIYKSESFTPVPNTAPYVRGVFNLRGEIISVVDLRRMFNMSVLDKVEGETEDIVFLKTDDHLTGVVVDLINDVVGVDSSTIQPPHPIFGDINIKYISGVVEVEDKLYIILDIETILGTEDNGLGGSTIADQEPRTDIPAPPIKPAEVAATSSPIELGFSFITETLATLASFYVGDMNEGWVKARFSEWRSMRGPDTANIQLRSHEDAYEFLQGFQSTDTGAFWSQNLASSLQGIMPDVEGNVISVWDIGCGVGHEAYSLAALLRAKYPDKQVKIWAQDNNLINVSNAPNLVFSESELPDWIQPFAQEGGRGHIFKKEIADSILFEYHDALHDSPLPPLQAVVARDLLSYQSPEDRQRLIRSFNEKLVAGGVLVIGEHEQLHDDVLTEMEQGGFRWYVKKG